MFYAKSSEGNAAVKSSALVLAVACLVLQAVYPINAAAELVLSVSPGVSLSPGNATIGGVATGPLNGTTYGPVGYASAPGGTTGFVTSSFVIPVSSGSYQLVWEVSDVGDTIINSALAIDNVRITSGSSTALLFGFESGIPAGFSSFAGSVSGTSAAVANLAPTEGARFAFIDTTGSYNTAMGTNGSRLISTMFSAAAGDIIAIDTAFLTNDATSSFGDYGFAALSMNGGASYSTVLFTAVAPQGTVAVPEIDPAGFGSVAALVTGALGLIERRRLKAKAA